MTSSPATLRRSFCTRVISIFISSFFHRCPFFYLRLIAKNDRLLFSTTPHCFILSLSKRFVVCLIPCNSLFIYVFFIFKLILRVTILHNPFNQNCYRYLNFEFPSFIILGAAVLVDAAFVFDSIAFFVLSKYAMLIAKFPKPIELRFSDGIRTIVLP